MKILEKIQYIIEGTGFDINIEKATIDNNNFRKVLFTAKNMQLVLMSVEDDIGMEVHKDTDQFFRIEKGKGKATIGNRTFSISDGSSFIVPMGNKHNVINTGDEPLKLYAIYSPPHHPDGKIDKTKPEENKEEVSEGDVKPTKQQLAALKKIHKKSPKEKVVTSFMKGKNMFVETTKDEYNITPDGKIIGGAFSSGNQKYSGQ